ncbi:MAG: DNA repair protein RecN [Rhodobacterales bacterium]|nr:DNA repair protein RecN [Rhodobacterales bacterium]
MLRDLQIRDMLIIERLDLSFQPGLNVLTGETGAGKSILLDALGFVLGWRGRAELVRKGASQGSVTATFDLPAAHLARAVLDEAGFDPDDDLILRRVNYSDGRKAAWVNDRKVSGDLLRALSDTLVELHGQQDDRGLLDPRGHRELLDDFAASTPLLTETRTAWDAVRTARRECDRLKSRLDDIRKEEGDLRRAVKELEDLDPRPGESADLTSRYDFMKAAARLHEPVIEAANVLLTPFPDGKGFPYRIGASLRRLERVADLSQGRLTPAIEALNRALAALEEAGSELESVSDSLEFDEAEFTRVAKRIDKLGDMALKYRIGVEDLPDLLVFKKSLLSALDDSGLDSAAATAVLSLAMDTYTSVATRLSAHRREAAQHLTAAMTAELAPLRMERAIFTIAMTVAEPGPEGIDAVTFEVSTNPGAPSGPLNRIASGGELSRFLLALKVCLTKGNTGLTLIFDEIDRGVGGATADAVGRRLADLAQAGQVLVVTHSPQVAAKAQHHWRVEKTVTGDMTTSRVVELGPAARIDEIARMLAGDTVTEAARGAARVLLEGTPA